jgi:hypothetical protein
MTDLTPLPPWHKEVFSSVEIEWDREIAIGRIGDAQSTADVVEYSEASGREGDPGAAATVLDDSLKTIDSIQKFWSDLWSDGRFTPPSSLGFCMSSTSSTILLSDTG